MQIFANSDELFHAAAMAFTQDANTKVNSNGVFNVVLSGGSTPKSLFDLLTISPYKEQIPWQKIQFFFGDERYVAQSDSASNYHMACEHLFSKVSVLQENIYPIPTEFKDANEAALTYATTLRQVLKVDDSSIPKFDLNYLGLGSNAHTASLMPQSNVVKAYEQGPYSVELQRQLVVALWVPALNMYRVTMTPPLLNNSERIVFIAIGAAKAQAVWQVLQGPRNPRQYPAQLIGNEKHVPEWMLDTAAAAQLKPMTEDT